MGWDHREVGDATAVGIVTLTELCHTHIVGEYFSQVGDGFCDGDLGWYLRVGPVAAQLTPGRALKRGVEGPVEVGGGDQQARQTEGSARILLQRESQSGDSVTDETLHRLALFVDAAALGEQALLQELAVVCALCFGGAEQPHVGVVHPGALDPAQHQDPCIQHPDETLVHGTEPVVRLAR